MQYLSKKEAHGRNGRGQAWMSECWRKYSTAEERQWGWSDVEREEPAMHTSSLTYCQEKDGGDGRKVLTVNTEERRRQALWRSNKWETMEGMKDGKYVWKLNLMKPGEGVKHACPSSSDCYAHNFYSKLKQPQAWGKWPVSPSCTHYLCFCRGLPMTFLNLDPGVRVGLGREGVFGVICGR